LICIKYFRHPADFKGVTAFYENSNESPHR
jgi:hypothetical protein